MKTLAWEAGNGGVWGGEAPPALGACLLTINGTTKPTHVVNHCGTYKFWRPRPNKPAKAKIQDCTCGALEGRHRHCRYRDHGPRRAGERCEDCFRLPVLSVGRCQARQGVLLVATTHGDRAEAKWRCQRCGSWRHTGPCQQFRAGYEVERLQRRYELEGRPDQAYTVLTAAQHEGYELDGLPVRAYATPEAAEVALHPNFKAFMREIRVTFAAVRGPRKMLRGRLRRRCKACLGQSERCDTCRENRFPSRGYMARRPGIMGFRRCERYATIEWNHAPQYPHMNGAIDCPGLVRALKPPPEVHRQDRPPALALPGFSGHDLVFHDYVVPRHGGGVEDLADYLPEEKQGAFDAALARYLDRGEAPAKPEYFSWRNRHCPTLKLLNYMAVKHGFGLRFYIDLVTSPEHFEKYLVKEVSKTYQIKPDYPRGFRRIRPSRGFFEKVRAEQHELEEHLWDYLAEHGIRVKGQFCSATSIKDIAREKPEGQHQVGDRYVFVKHQWGNHKDDPIEAEPVVLGVTVRGSVEAVIGLVMTLPPPQYWKEAG